VQLGEGGGVEGARRDARDAERAQASAHLAGRLGGEGDRHDPARGVGAGLDAVRDAVRDDARLTGARTGEHRDGSAEGRGGLALAIVETVECAHPRSSYQSTMRPWAMDAALGSP